jgi:hypothetical protein
MWQQKTSLAQQGMVKLKSGQSVYYKHVDELTREARIAAEMEEVEWLKRRLGVPKERGRWK